MDLRAAGRTLQRTVERSMIYRCSILRDAADGEDSWGGKGEPDFRPHLIGVRCYAHAPTSGSGTAAREPVDERVTATLLDRRVLLPKGTDVTEADQIGDVIDPRIATESGSGEDNPDPRIVLEGPMGVEGVIRRLTHVEVLVERIR